MITETQTSIIILHLTDELLARLHPFMVGLGIHVTPHSTRGEQHELRLTMRAEVYAALVERVGSTLDYDVRWQPNEYEPDGFVEHVRPLELTNRVYQGLWYTVHSKTKGVNRHAPLCKRTR
jgi:hypothetical protein